MNKVDTAKLCEMELMSGDVRGYDISSCHIQMFTIYINMSQRKSRVYVYES